ncbi:MAG: cytochrome c3 family protein [Bdellovibrionales bacterium]
MSQKIIGLVVVLGALLGLSTYVYLINNNKIVLGYNQGYQPDQPIPFSHKLHAGQYKIDCKYCHVAVTKSRHASVPSLNICMNCHMVVKTDSPWIQKLTEAYNSGKSVAWQKVHLLPDFVKFSHAPHIKAGKDCTVCHGPVAEMEKIQQVQSLSMGFCVNCHRQPENKAPLNCSTCHY